MLSRNTCSSFQRLSLFLLAIVLTPSIKAEPLVFSYWTKASEPFVFVDNDQLVGGLVMDMGKLIGQQLGREITYRNFPHIRIENQLSEGKVDFDCLTNPAWKHHAGQYRWSPALFEDEDVFVVRKGEENDIQSFNDLIGKRLGVYSGYVYHPEIMRLIESGDIETVKISGVDKGIMLLQLKRIDAFIEFGIIMHYKIQQQALPEKLALASHPADSFELFCAYAPKQDLPEEHINAMFDALIKEGALDQLLAKYR